MRAPLWRGLRVPPGVGRSNAPARSNSHGAGMAFSPKAVTRQNKWLRDLTRYEDVALGMLKPIDLLKMDPIIVEARPGTHRRLYDYWRVVISSKLQFTKPGVFRRQFTGFVMDRRTDGLLGVIGQTDLPLTQNRSWIVECLGPRQDRYGGVLVQRRCLPIFELGQLTGGKLLYLLSTSREHLHSLEMEFTQLWGTIIVPTEERQSSQFNRLPGLDRAWFSDDKSIYRQELRNGHTRFLAGEDVPWMTWERREAVTDAYGYWRARWLIPRAARLSLPTTITPDAEQYRLTKIINAKKMRFSLETPDEADIQEGQDPRSRAHIRTDRRAG